MKSDYVNSFQFAQIKSEYEVGDMCYENVSMSPDVQAPQITDAVYKHSTFPSVQNVIASTITGFWFSQYFDWIEKKRIKKGPCLQISTAPFIFDFEFIAP